VFAVGGAGRVGNDFAVGDGGVVFVDNESDAKDGLVGRLVEGGEGTAGIGGFKLRDGVAAAGGLAEIETAELVVQDSRKANVDLGGARGNDTRDGQSCGLVFFILGDRGGLFEVSGTDPHFLKIDFGGIQHDGSGGLLEMNADEFVASERGVGKIRLKSQVVGVRNDIVGEPLPRDD
jgi:hypothetical protein